MTEIESELLAALKRMYSMWKMMMDKVDHGRSFYDGKTIMEMNEAPIQAIRAIRKAEGN